MSKITFFEKIRNSRATRLVCAFLALNLIIEVISPAMAMALTSGPSQPEFASFEPVATTDMVNDFTGDFTYNLPVLNVPGPDGGGYSMSLSYHSGVSSEEEASWVGFGWTLNPGAINRNKRGYADEFNGVNVEQYSKTRPNWTQTAKFDFNMEYNSRDKKPSDSASANKGKSILKFIKKYIVPSPKVPGNSPAEDVSVSLSHTIRYNNYTGFSIGTGIGVGFKGMASLSMNHSGAQNTLGFSVNPIAIMKRAIAGAKKKNKENQTATKTEDAPPPKVKDSFKKSQIKKNLVRNLSSNYSFSSYNVPALPYSVGKMSSAAWNFSGSFQFNPAQLPIGFQVGIAGHMNIQVPQGKTTLAAYGYMHSYTANDGELDDNQSFDYQMEKESTFDKNDKYLGIPFNSADIFSATGNGVVGGFRLQHEKIGSFFPTYSTSHTRIKQTGIEGGIGVTGQVGFDVGTGKQTTTVKGNWPKHTPYDQAGLRFSKASKPLMRFTNDPGGEINYGDEYDAILYAAILQNKTLDLGQGADFNLLLTNKSTSSSFIDYEKPESEINSQPTINPGISGIKITNKDGGKSNYSQPVYTKNEAELNIGLEQFKDGNYLSTQKLYVTDPLKNKTVTGQKTAAEYASSYLLTSNTTFNYVDADNIPGPSAGDFGGWTKFDYKRAWGGSNAADWYHYRSPYAGLKYNNGRLLDPNDQTGSMSCGDKEIYYLKCIETKSHIAFFITNKTNASQFASDFPYAQYPYLYTGSPLAPVAAAGVTTNINGSGITRFDGIDAKAINGAGEDEAALDLNSKGTHTLQKLEKIVLFAKADLSKPLTTTFFEYEYSLCRGIPNYTAAAGAPANGGGKLTLKQVWTESNGITRSQIAPYTFHYNYFHNYPEAVYNRYPWANTDFNLLYTDNDASQNPAYSPSQLDAWGFYQQHGDKRNEFMQPWLSQQKKGPDASGNEYNPGNGSDFDPAAWQLKRIQLPSGGEIHVHYEQKDYSWVEDEKPMAMVSLKADDPTNPVHNIDEYTADESVFCVNTTNIVDDENIANYRDTLKKYFLDQRNKLYFKVLYSLTGKDVPQINSEDRRFEYVTGYTTVHDVIISSGKIYLKLGDISDGNTDKKDQTLPRYVCYQELSTNGGRNLGLNAQNYKSEDYTDDIYNDLSGGTVNVDDIRSVSGSKVIPHTLGMFADWITGKVKNENRKKACKQLNFDLSYFKLPVYKEKKGGGIRVKRLLMYDPGMLGETGGAMIYGSEYIYKNKEGFSSGVAVNEPGSIREESALVKFIERKKQKTLDKIMNGKDTKQFEGPLGENLLPAATVAHSRIIIRNIHDKQSTTGYLVNTYHTSKDFPMEMDNTLISKKDRTYRKLNIKIPLGIFNMEIHKAFVTQGYIFKLNDMHGKIASKATYAGSYYPNTFNESSFTSQTTYKYSAPGEKISSLVYDGTKIKRELLNPGTEEDFTIFTSNVREKANDFSFEMDYNWGIPASPPITWGSSFSYNDNMLCQQVVSKVVNQTSYLLSTTSTNDGVTQTTENLGFDKYTNDPVLTRTYDGYSDPNVEKQIKTVQGSGTDYHKGYYYSMNIPASWMYAAMGPKTGANTNSNQLTAMAGNVVTYSVNSMYTDLTNSGIWIPTGNPLTNVVSASATTFKNQWFDASLAPQIQATNTTNIIYQANLFYYPLRSYAYLDNVKDANTANGRIYNAGMINQPFTFFNWQTAATGNVPSQWYSDSKVTKYSPHGYPIEEEDVLGIKSAAHFGYNDQLPVLVAKNAGYNAIKFVDFEYGISNTHITKTTAHSGAYSFMLSAEQSYPFVKNYPLTQNTFDHGLSIKLWLKSVRRDGLNAGLKNTQPKLKAVIAGKKFDFEAIAQTGEWTLYSSNITVFSGIAIGLQDITLDYNYIITSPSEEVYVDDFRVQPLDASANCSVYYADNKLAAQFDDQHFGVFYEYNTKGQLVRKSIETERGKKTLQEQQYNTPLITR